MFEPRNPPQKLVRMLAFECTVSSLMRWLKALSSEVGAPINIEITIYQLFADGKKKRKRVMLS